MVVLFTSMNKMNWMTIFRSCRTGSKLHHGMNRADIHTPLHTLLTRYDGSGNAQIKQWRRLKSDRRQRSLLHLEYIGGDVDTWSQRAGETQRVVQCGLVDRQIRPVEHTLCIHSSRPTRPEAGWITPRVQRHFVDDATNLR